jgi:hypothetical protein
MCIDPITMIAMAGSAISAGGALMQGKQAAAMADYQAQVYKRQAEQEQQASAYEQQRERHRQELAQSAARAQVGASGVALQGSPAEVLAANARQGELDVQGMRYGSQLRSNALSTQGDISQFSGKQARQASYLAGASTLLSGVGSAVRMGGNPFQ